LKKIGNFPFHPLLWAIFPILALLGYNISQVPPGDAVRSLLASLILCGLGWVLLRLVMRSWTRAAIVVSGFLLLFFSYGHVYHQIEYLTILGINLGRHRVLLPLFILILAVIIFWSLRQKDLRGVTRALNLLGLVVLVIPLYQIVSYEVKISSLLAGEPQQNLLSQVAGLKISTSQRPPDIYYIILDTYTRADALSTNFGYDNHALVNELERRGFFIAGCSQSNYSFTAMSLASSLNYNYIPDLNPSFTSTNTDETSVYPYLFNNAVVFTLRKLGYKFVSFESGFSPTEFTNADIYYTQQSDWLGILLEDGINPFEAMQIDTSAAMFVYELSPHLPVKIQQFLSLDTAYVVHRNRILYSFYRLERLGTLAGPKFVFVHILAPHNPFVFGANGEYLQRKTPFTLNDDLDAFLLSDYIAGYDAQVTYINQRILSVVDALLKTSTNPPVIIIQGDHGVPRMGVWRDTILNAYYLPGISTTQLYTSISPVNTFRVIFDSYFAGQLPLLPDRSCSTNAQTDPFGCTPMPDPNPQCRAAANQPSP
jgi:hypothetical protein